MASEKRLEYRRSERLSGSSFRVPEALARVRPGEDQIMSSRLGAPQGLMHEGYEVSVETHESDGKQQQR